jgi:hypothetical protein
VPQALSGVDLTEVYGAERKFSPDSDAVSLPNTRCLHFEFRYLCSVDRVDQVYAESHLAQTVSPVSACNISVL